jgi:hypothetical protein
MLECLMGMKHSKLSALMRFEEPNPFSIEISEDGKGISKKSLHDSGNEKGTIDIMTRYIYELNEL